MAREEESPVLIYLNKVASAIKQREFEFRSRQIIEYENFRLGQRTELERLVWEARNVHGVSIAAIARAYGTTDRRTIMNMIARHEETEAVSGGTRIVTRTLIRNELFPDGGFRVDYRIDDETHFVAGYPSKNEYMKDNQYITENDPDIVWAIEEGYTK